MNIKEIGELLVKTSELDENERKLLVSLLSGSTRPIRMAIPLGNTTKFVTVKRNFRKTKEREDKIVSYLENGAKTTSEIREHFGWLKASTNNRLLRLVKESKISRIGVTIPFLYGIKK